MSHASNLFHMLRLLLFVHLMCQLLERRKRVGRRGEESLRICTFEKDAIWSTNKKRAGIAPERRPVLYQNETGNIDRNQWQLDKHQNGEMEETRTLTTEAMASRSLHLTPCRRFSTLILVLSFSTSPRASMYSRLLRADSWTCVSYAP